jgi:hypothetical protein
MPPLIRDAARKTTSHSGLASVHIREASFGDYDAICALESNYGLVSKEYDEWTHLWTCNPASGPNKPKWPIGWILEKHEQVVGYVGNIPLLYELAGQPLIAAATRAWVVDTGYRNYSIPLLQHYFTQPNVDLYLGTTANAQSSPVLGMFNSVPVPVGAWDRSAFWITNTFGFASSLLAMRDITLRRPLSHALSGALTLRMALAGQRSADSNASMRVDCSDNFDDRFDRFWEAFRKENTQLLLAVRTREVLEWHFKYARLKDQLWVYTIAGDAGLVAYSIFCRQDNPKFGLKRVRLIDFQALGGQVALLRPILCSAIDRCQNEGIHMLEYIGVGRKVGHLISTLKPCKRRLPSWLYYYKPASERLRRLLADPGTWDPSGFDGDFSL